MSFDDYQRWFKAYDAARGFDSDLPLESLAHLSEEVGEIATHLLRLNGVKAMDEALRHEEINALALELSDAFVFLTKIANSYEISWETTIERAIAKAEARWDVNDGQSEAARRESNRI